MNIVLFGPPGAGKGTQSKFIVNKFNLYQLSTGDLLRNEIKNKTQLGSEISSIMTRAFPFSSCPVITRRISKDIK